MFRRAVGGVERVGGGVGVGVIALVVRRRLGRLGRRVRLARRVRRQQQQRRLGRALARLHVLAVRVLVEAALGHEQRGDGARRQPHGRRARRDAAAPALAARVVQHAQRAARLPNALCGTRTRSHTRLAPPALTRYVTAGRGRWLIRGHVSPTKVLCNFLQLYKYKLCLEV